MRTVVIEMLRYQATCANCGTRTVAERPTWFTPHATFGPRVEASRVYLHETHHVSYERLVEWCQDVLGRRVSQGAIAHVLGRVASRADPAVERIREQVRTSLMINRLCLAHQLRELTYATEADGPPGSWWARQPRHVFGRALRLHRERKTLSVASFAQRRVRVVNPADQLIFGPPLGHGEAWQLQKRYRKYWATLFVFLDRQDVEPTNNSSERDLRPAVMHRKMTGGYRSETRAQSGGIFATVLATARKNQVNRFETLCRITGPSPLPAAYPGCEQLRRDRLYPPDTTR